MELIATNESIVELVHDSGEKLQWDVSVFDRTRFNNLTNVFRDINGYWKFIGPTRCQKIWEIYKQIHHIWYGHEIISHPVRQIIELIGQMYDHMPQQELEHWVKFNSQVRYQDTLQIEHDPEDQNPGRTYLYADYQGLVVLTVAVRPMVPLWGEFIERVKDEVGIIYKEYTAMKLLGRSWIMHSSYMERLKIYIENSNLNTISNVAAILSGLGTDELPDFFMALVLIRRVAIGDIDASPEKGSIISNIYGFITSLLRDFDKRFGRSGIKEKHPDDIKDDESSLQEAYKVKQPVTHGDVGIIAHYLLDPYLVARTIDPTIPPTTVQICLTNAACMQGLKIDDVHITLCQWTLAQVVPPRSIPLMNKATLIQALAVTQAILWHWGFVELASLCISELQIQTRELTMTTDVKTRMSNELLNQLNALYPHMYQNDKQGVGRRANVAYSAILKLVEHINAGLWDIRSPVELVQMNPLITSRGTMACPANIVETLARFIIRINTVPQAIPATV